jgi:hypothetical protein
MLLAMLKAAQADYFCPSTPPTKGKAYRHFLPYMRATGNYATPLTAPSGFEVRGAGKLAEVAWQYTAAFMGATCLEAMQQLHALAIKLSNLDYAPAGAAGWQRAAAGAAADSGTAAIQLLFFGDSCCKAGGAAINRTAGRAES